MEKLTLLEFLKKTPIVSFDYVGAEPEKWKFFWDGAFGQGYYKLTRNGRRNPLHKFKAALKIFNEYSNNKCIIYGEGS